MSKLALQKHREREMAAARTSEEVYALMDRWGDEDEAAARAERAEAREIEALRRRVAVLEKLLGPGGKKIIGPLCRSIGEFVPEYFERQLERRKVMRECGVWSDSRSYAPGDFVTHRGAGWVAQIESTGSRPGDGAAWRLAIKSGETVKGK